MLELEVGNEDGAERRLRLAQHAVEIRVLRANQHGDRDGKRRAPRVREEVRGVRDAMVGPGEDQANAQERAVRGDAHAHRRDGLEPECRGGPDAQDVGGVQSDGGSARDAPERVELAPRGRAAPESDEQLSVKVKKQRNDQRLDAQLGAHGHARLPADDRGDAWHHQRVHSVRDRAGEEEHEDDARAEDKTRMQRGL